MKPLLLALDFGGTKHSAALLRRGDTDWRAHRRASAPPVADARADLDVMLALAHELLGDAQPDATGVSFGGPVDAATGTVRLSHHVPGWNDFPLGMFLLSRVAAPVAVDNDANAGALGEYRFGSGRGCHSLLYITVSTGVGGGWVLDGKVWRGADGLAGEIGHTVVDPAGPLCLCGKRGCVERLASGPYIAQDALSALTAAPEAGPILRALAQDDLSHVTAKLVADAASRGDELSTRLITRAGHALGVGIGNAANLMNPERIVLTGGVTKAGDLFWSAVRSSARAIGLPQVRIDILPASLLDDAPLWGAAALADALI